MVQSHSYFLYWFSLHLEHLWSSGFLAPLNIFLVSRRGGGTLSVVLCLSKRAQMLFKIPEIHNNICFQLPVLKSLTNATSWYLFLIIPREGNMCFRPMNLNQKPLYTPEIDLDEALRSKACVQVETPLMS